MTCGTCARRQKMPSSGGCRSARACWLIIAAQRAARSGRPQGGVQQSALKSKGRSVSHDALQGAPAHQAHGRVALDVIPDRPYRLLKCPRLATFPLEVLALEVASKHLPRAVLK